MYVYIFIFSKKPAANRIKLIFKSFSINYTFQIQFTNIFAFYSF